MLPVSDLTDEQRAIVRHTDGPALVFAVAGAGKTTSMVHRIRALVDVQNVAPSQILASSFSRSTVDDLRVALDDLGVGGVDVRTLHSLGLRVIRSAERRGLLPPRTRQQDESPDTLARILASRALTKLAIERDLDSHELGIDRDELLDQIAAWKQQLAYPDLDRADLPDDAADLAAQAEHDNEDFVTLYRLYESMRDQESWLTYDDMLVEGWESLLRFPEVRADTQANYRHVLVDEFQDVSRVQFLILDVLTAPHRNYMAIGDDDQCIYEWRGADPSFILDFPDRYDAETYLIRNNFRSTASHVALANAVIEHNDTRYDKQLHLTRGFDGDTEIVAASGPRDEAEQIVDRLQTATGDDTPQTLSDCVVLVRTYAQTPFLESILIDREIDYRIVGHVPFYRRREVQTLLRYLFWATLERQVDDDGWFDRRRDAARYVDRFSHILKEPNRYVKHDTIDRICQRAVREKTSVLDVLTASLASVHNRTADRLEDFLDTCEGLLLRLDRPANETLDWLIDDLDYASYLRRRSAIEEVGEARVRTARSLVAFAEGHPSAKSLLREIVTLSRRRPDPNPDPNAPEPDVLEIRSIHRAKGAEWPVVFVPGCNDGTLPQRKTRTKRSSRRVTSFEEFVQRDREAQEEESLPVDLEEERRLLYVAITRAQSHLVLSYDDDEDVSPFLQESDAEGLVETARRLRGLLGQDPSGWSDDDTADVCAGVDRLSVERYFEAWWDADPDVRDALRTRLDAFAPVHEAAREKMDAYAEAVDTWEDAYAAQLHEQRNAASGGAAREVIGELRDLLGNAAIPVAHDGSAPYYDADAQFTFAWNGEEETVDVFHDGDTVGTVALFQSSRLTPSVALRLPWDDIVASFARVGRGRDVLYATVDYPATRQNLVRRSDADEAPSPDVPDAPDEPDARVQHLASASVRRGLTALQSATAPVQPAA